MKNKLIFSILFACFLNVFSVQANEKLDSLLVALSDLINKNSASEVREKALLCREIADWYQEAYTDQEYTRVYLLQSIDHSKKCISMEKKPDDYIFLSNLYRDLSLFELFKGNVKESNAYILLCEQTLFKLKNKIPDAAFDKATFEFYHSTFALYFTVGNFAEAERSMQKAFEITDRDTSLAKMKINLYSEISICYAKQNKIQESIDAALTGLKLYEQKPLTDQPHDRFLNFYLRAEFTAGNFETVDSIIKSYPIYDSFESMSLFLDQNKDLVTRSFFENLFLVGAANRELFIKTGKIEYLQTGYQWLKDAFLLAEELTLYNGGERLGNSLVRPREKLGSLLQIYGDFESKSKLTKLKIAELLKIIDVYQSNRLHLERISHQANAQLWVREKELKNEIDFIMGKIEELSKIGGKEAEIDSLSTLFNQKTIEIYQIKRKSKREKVLTEYQISTSDFALRFQNHLKKSDKTLLTYFYFQPHQSIYIIGASGDTAFFRTVSVPETVVSEIESAYFLNAAFQSNPETIAEQRKLNHLLYSYLIEPVKDLLKTEQLLIYPLHEISYISFDALIDNNDQYLVESYSFQYTSSLYSLMDQPPSNSAPREKPISFYPSNYGNDSLAYLVNAKNEIESLEKMLGAQTMKDSAATKQNFIQTTNNRQLIHLASHSILDFNRPYESYILFNDEGDSTANRLYAYEIFSMSISSDLITLSSCNSAKGKVEEGIGIVSLSNAFYFAGVPATVSSLWSAQDKSSSEIMASFYQNLANGDTKSESLRKAKLAYLKGADKLKSQPFFWANYVLFGNDTPLFEAEKKTPWYSYVIGLLVAVALFFVGRSYFRSLNKA